MPIIIKHFVENGHECSRAIDRNNDAFVQVSGKHSKFIISCSNGGIVSLFGKVFAFFACSHRINIHNPNSFVELLSVVRSCDGQCNKCPSFRPSLFNGINDAVDGINDAIRNACLATATTAKALNQMANLLGKAIKL